MKLNLAGNDTIIAQDRVNMFYVRHNIMLEVNLQFNKPYLKRLVQLNLHNSYLLYELVAVLCL